MSGIEKLEDCRGSYRLKAECDVCGHGKILDLEQLIRHYGPNFPISGIRNRVRCNELRPDGSKCGARTPNVRVQLIADDRRKP